MALRQLLSVATRIWPDFLIIPHLACPIALGPWSRITPRASRTYRHAWNCPPPPQENITRAKAAEQEDAAKFMEKVKQACEKYAIISPAVEVLPPTAPMPGKAGKAAPVVTSPGGIILPGSVSTPPPAAAAPAAKVPAGAKPAGPSGLIL